VVIAIAAVEYLISNKVGPLVLEGLALTILNGIATAVNAQTKHTLKAEIELLNKQIEAYIARIAEYNRQGK
jgi:hypothetical protein